MAEYDNNLSGVLFKNDQKGNEKAPWYKGNIEIGGIKYDLAAWVRESKAGNKFLSLKATDPTLESERPAPQTMLDEEIPF